jgi:hypothetical protein
MQHRHLTAIKDCSTATSFGHLVQITTHFYFTYGRSNDTAFCMAKMGQDDPNEGKKGIWTKRFSFL